MQKIKNEKGVTMVSLVVTIIVFLIILGISLNLGIISTDETKSNKMQAELQMIQQVAISEYVKAKKLNYTNSDEIPPNYVGTIIDVLDLPMEIEWQITENPSERYKAYYVVTPEQLADIEVSNAEDTYIINYYTGEVYNKTQKEDLTGKVLYIKATSNTTDISNTTVKQKTEDTESFNDWVE